MLNANTYTSAERAAMLVQMRHAASVFYSMATQIGCHPFIEITGVMNEYIKCCEKANQAGIDFTLCNAHSGQKLPMPRHSIDYINEKLECIFTGRSVLTEAKK